MNSIICVVGFRWKVIARIKAHFYLARTVVAESAQKVHFIILDDRNPGFVVMHFEWSLDLFWAMNGMRKLRQCTDSCVWPHFHATVSHSGSYVILVGPDDWTEDDEDNDNVAKQAIPASKVLYTTTWSIEVWPFRLQVNQESKRTCHFLTINVLASHLPPPPPSIGQAQDG